MTSPSDRQVPEEASKPPSRTDLARDVRRLVRCALKGALGTLDRTTGHPYASLVTIATDSRGAPLLLLSRLAQHTQNLLADPRASLLVDATDATGDPLAGGRATLIGTLVATRSEADRARFLTRHPAAAMYAGFSDFAFYRLEVARTHYVGGFGRIVDFSPDEIMISVAGAESLIEAEAGIVGHMNEDHLDAIELYANEIAREKSSGWRLTGVDPDGFDLVTGGQAQRIEFGTRVTTPAAIRDAFVALAAQARSARS